MNEVHQFLNETYSKTKYPFFSLAGLRLAFGDETSEQLNQLRDKGIVRRRKGANGPIVELIKT